MSQTQHLLHFISHNIHYCIDLSFVEKTIVLPKIDPYPNAPNYLIGVLNLAGENIPIINLAMRFGFNQTKIYHIDTPIIICKQNDKHIGLLVDNIISVVTTDKQAMQTPLQFSAAASPVMGVVNIGTQIALQLNIAQVANLALNLPKQALAEFDAYTTQVAEDE